MASESELADLYLSLRAVTAPMITGITDVGVAGEEMVAKLIAGLAEVNTGIVETGDMLAALRDEMASVRAEGAAGITSTATAAATAPATGAVGATAVEAAGGAEAAVAGAASTDAMAAEGDKLIAEAAKVGAASDEMALKWSADFAKMAAATEAANSKLIASADAAAASTAKVTDKVIASDSATPAWASKLSSLSGSLLKVGAAGGILGGAAIKMAADWQTSTTKIVTSGGETADAMKNIVSPTMLQYMGQFGVSSKDITAAMYKISSGGYTAANGGLAVLKAALQGGKMEGADFVTAGDAVTDVLKDYNLPGTQAASVMSKLVQTTALGKTTLGELAGSLHSVVPVAAAMKIPFADIAGAYAEMTTHGMSADQTTQNLSHTLGKMQTTTKPMRDELGQLGINATQLNDSLGTKGLTGTLQSISDAIIKKMGPAGKVVLSAFNQSATATTNFQTAISKAPVAVSALAKELNAGTVSYTDYQKAIKALPANQYELASSMGGMWQQANGFTNSLKNGSPQIQDYAQAMQAATGDATTYRTALMLTNDNYKDTASNVKKISAATATASGDVRGWSEVQNNFNQRLSQAKGGLEATAISIGQKLLPVATTLLRVIGDVTSWLASNKVAADALAIVIGVLLVGGLIGVIGKLGMFGVAMAKNFISPVTGSIGFIKNFSGAVEGTAGGALRTFAGNAASAGGAVGRFVSSMGSGLLTGLKTAVGAIGDLGKAMGVAMVNGARAMATALTESVLPALGDAAVATWDFTIALLANPITWIVIGIVALVVAIVLLITHWKQVEAFLRNVWNAFISWAKGVWNHVADFFKDLWNKVSGFFKDIWNDITGWLKKKWDEGVHKDVAIWNEVLDFFKNLWNNVKNWVTSKVNEIVSGIKKEWNDFLDFWHKLGDTINKAIEDAWSNVIKFFKAIPDKIGDAFKDAGKWLLNAGKAILEGLLGGLKDAWNHVTGFIGGIGDWISQHKGPIEVDRTLLTPHGNAIMQGLLTGLQQGGAHVARYLDGFTQSIGATGGGALNGSITVNGSMPAIQASGNSMVPSSGSGASMGNVYVTVNVQGSVTTENDLVRSVQSGILQLAGRNTVFGTTNAFQ